MKLMMLMALAGVFGFASSAKAQLDVRPPREVLPGHWKNAAGKLHYYFEKDRVTLIDSEKLIGVYPYEIVEEHILQNLIKIKLKSDEASLRDIRVDFKRKGFMESFQVKSATINNIMLYVDDKRAP